MSVAPILFASFRASFRRRATIRPVFSPPGFSRACHRGPRAVSPRRMVPRSIFFWEMHCSGHTKRHTLQPSQKPSSTTAFPSRTWIASYLQADSQIPHPVHRSRSASAMDMPEKGSRRVSAGCSRRARFGASTSASARIFRSSATAAREAVRVVFPVPPLPLIKTTSRMLMRISFRSPTRATVWFQPIRHRF